MIGLLNTTPLLQHIGKVRNSNQLGNKAKTTEGGSGNRNSRLVVDLGSKNKNRNKGNIAKRHGENSKKRDRQSKGRINNNITADLIHSLNSSINKAQRESTRSTTNACGKKECDGRTSSEYEKRKSIGNMMRLDIKGRGQNGRKSLKGGNRNGVDMINNKIKGLMIFQAMKTNMQLEQPKICGKASSLLSLLFPLYFGT